MAIDVAALIEDTKALGAAHAAITDTSTIVFHEEYRKACQQNRCGRWDTSWMGPPAVGSVEECRARVLQFKQGLLFQSIYRHESTSTFDYKGMLDGAKVHDVLFRKVLQTMRSKYSFQRLFPMAAGCCNICKRCSYLDKEPCRHPDQAITSVEGYGIDVMALEVKAGIPYYNGKGTYSFVGLILFEE